MESLPIEDGNIEYEIYGTGEPVVLIHLSLLADGLCSPLLTQKELLSNYQLIHYHRRGYMGSKTGIRPLTISEQAADLAIVMNHLDVKSAHLVGHSFGGNIALQFAVDAPEKVHSLSLLEPFLPMVPSGNASFEKNTVPAIKAYRSGDKPKAVMIFCNNIFGPDWQSIVEQTIPDALDQIMIGMDTFMRELSSFQEWHFGSQLATKLDQPILSVVGARTQKIMFEGRELLHSWVPQIEDLDIPSTHLLQLQDPYAVVSGLSEFFRRHSIQ